MSTESRVTDVYVVQYLWRMDGYPDEWVDYRLQITDIDRAREMLDFVMAKIEGPWRIVHRVTSVVETVVE